MRSRFVYVVPLLIALSLLSCEWGMPLPTATPTPIPYPYTGYLTAEIPPCTLAPPAWSVDPCDPDAPPIETGIAQSFSELGDEPSGVRAMLEDGLSPPAWISHLAVRGTYLLGTVRCTAGDPFRPPAYLSNEFNYEVNPSAIKCYIDVRANAYILGSGPSTLTTLLFSYTYWDHQYTPYLEEGQTEQDLVEEFRLEIETDIGDVFPGRENILFLGPPVDLSSEAWRFLGYWDVQREEDGTVVAVHPNRDLWRRLRPDDYQAHRDALEMDLATFTRAVTTANEARVTEYGGRIGADTSLPMLVTDANQLESYFREVGAYDDPDNPPAQPPPP